MSVANPPSPANSETPLRGDFSVCIFAKAPVVGQCKTRLARRLGARRATRIYRAMLEHAVSQAVAIAPGRVMLACSPETRHPAFARLAQRYGVTRRRQALGTLGYRMATGVRQALQTSERVVVMGADQPALDGGWLEHALAHLTCTDHVWLAPTWDGGYWAIGLCHTNARIFRGPVWSTPRVARSTRTRAKTLGLELSALAPRRDIDDYRDWQQLPQSLRSSLARYATMPGLAGITRREP